MHTLSSSAHFERLCSGCDDCVINRRTAATLNDINYGGGSTRIIISDKVMHNTLVFMFMFTYDDKKERFISCDPSSTMRLLIRGASTFQVRKVTL